MCTFETLYIGEDGYVVRCACCNNYQVAAGAICITITAEEFKQLQKLAEEAHVHAGTQCTGHTKFYTIGTPYAGINFLFTQGELSSFNNMLEAADSEATALSLIGMFNNSCR